MRYASWLLVAAVFTLTGAGFSGARQAQDATVASGFACGGKLAAYIQTRLFLDRMIMGSTKPQRITDKRWKRFTQEVLMHEFPAGGTVFDDHGWWRSPSGRMDSSDGYMVVVTSPVAEAEAHRAAAGRVVEEVKRQFRHESVLREEEVVCAAF